MTNVTFRDVIDNIGTNTFTSYEALVKAAQQAFNQHVLSFPPGYSHFDVLEYGLQSKLIEKCADGSYIVRASSTPFTQSASTTNGVMAV